MSYADVSRRVDSARRLSKCLLTVCLTLATLTARLPEAAADTITAVPSSSNVLVNELFTVDFVLDDFTDLFLFQMGISYDPSLLLLVGDPTEGSHLASGGSFVSGDTEYSGRDQIHRQRVERSYRRRRRRHAVQRAVPGDRSWYGQHLCRLRSRPSGRGRPLQLGVRPHDSVGAGR